MMLQPSVRNVIGSDRTEQALQDCGRVWQDVAEKDGMRQAVTSLTK